MTDQNIVKLAKVLVNYSLNIQKGQYFFIAGHSSTSPLIQEIYREAVKVGANVEIRVGLSGLGRILFDNATDEQLQWISPANKIVYESADAFLSILGNDNFRELATVDPAKISLKHKVQGELSHKMIERAAQGKANWCSVQFPTPAGAQDANMSTEEFESLIWKTCLLDREDPVKAWEEKRKEQAKLIDWLKDKEVINVKAEGTDLTFYLKGRTWENCDGRLNMPDGEIYTGPIEDKTHGKIRFNITQVYAGQDADGIELTFKDGRVTSIKADRGEDFVKKMLNTDEGAGRVGEFAIGTNPGIVKPCRNLALDEKIAGTIHMALGFGIPQTGSSNQSSIHWDMILDMRPGGELTADGQLFYKDGKFTIF